LCARDGPAENIVQLDREINAALADSKFKARLLDSGGAPFPKSSVDLHIGLDADRTVIRSA
jgi:hypothetical protein